MEINHALVALVWGDGEFDVHHFCGYEKPPTEKEYNDLAHRLRTDPKYGMTEMKEYAIKEAPPSIVRYYKSLDPKDEGAYYVDESAAVLKM